MFNTARSFLSSHRDASELVKEAERFAVRLPLVGRVSVPPPDQLAFYGVLGGLAALGLIEWPVAVAIGVGQVVVSRHFADSRAAEEELPHLPTAAPAKKAVAKKAPATKAVAKKAVAKRTTPKKGPAKKAPNKAGKRTNS